MRKEKAKRLENKGWKIGSAEDFLGLSPEESAYIDLKLNLSAKLRKLRAEQNLTQTELAKLIHSSQSRVAKIETGDPTVSIDLIIKSLLALGASKKQLARAISS
ncbi:MAG: helix-turn-helix transcriptional regulator [Candidatus Marinimicrobia bacterium]|jgi:DNA-binding XRE family transcriptional regulator|nr:helix-turn-helix transcriptional regulator [Candidatus Neomarinimicrobiota bacterium]MBT3630189.1 helix-turn-helix transcriptional regulator [Candidatus Neomarinimicrobiota bacterium]MBT3826141.1 helix-turn-helix transcriptional regulator [Candidatus Neomarinimicrobiota bacterium]MBT4132175.1 helix-turn-helix transcriptional regulator [Candidatus Neomarinimicrobiota bacterium]MBT4296718.1 helix-turn-helix transcriptional regulator [Candidatus Neomarinimicrobiota bacterium]